MNLTNFRTLGHSGLIVSPMALGTMTFARQRWGASDEISKSIFHAYVEAGGNFIDTADIYAQGRSEELIGSYINHSSLRDDLVLATKFTFHGGKSGNPNAGGNGRKNMYRAIEGSLRRLKTDYIDLYWMHAWDMVTPVEEVLQSLGDLVRAGKIRYFGFSDVPAWYAAKAVGLATAFNVPAPIALQVEYSLVERNIENEHIPAARECGLGICAWSPLAGGFLTGKYSLENTNGQGRLSNSNPFEGKFTKFTDRNWRILDALQTVATEIDRPLAQVALAWVSAQPGITAPILGASKLEHLHGNLSSLSIRFAPDQIQTLKQSSALDLVFPYSMFTSEVKQSIFSGTIL